MVSFIGLMIAIVVLMVTTYRGMNLYLSTIICSILIAATGGLDLWDALQSGYAQTFGGFVISYLFMIVLGVLFGQILMDSGVAEVIGYRIVSAIGAKNAILGVIVINFVMGTIGITGYIIVFTTVPISMAMFKKAGLPVWIMPAAQQLGTTLGVGVLPYNPVMNNVIPTQYLGTTLGAQPILGIVAFISLFIPGWIYCARLSKKAGANMTLAEKEQASVEIQKFEEDYAAKDKPSLGLCLLPCIVVLAMLIGLDKLINSSALVVFAVAVGILLTTFTNWKRLKNRWQESYASGLNQGASSIMLCATVIGFGGVVQMSPAFKSVVDFCLNIPLHPYLTEIISINLLAGVTASAPAGIQIFMQSLSAQFLEMGMDPEIMHRLAPIAGFGLNSLPHSPSVVMALAYMGVSFKEGYKPVAVTCILMPTIASFITCFVGMLFF